MKRTSFNDGWNFRPKVSAFLERSGQMPSWSPVRLPHDAMIGATRGPSEGPGNAYFPDGTWEYQKHFTVPVDARGKRMLVEFEGVYRDASVWVNGSFAGHHPYGYTGFALAIDHLARHGDDNEIRVEVIAQEDARWYSGAGIYRNVKLVTGELVHLALDSLFVMTPELDDEIAVVQVNAVLENDGAVTTATSVVTEIVDDRGAVVASEVTPLTSFPRQSATLRQRLVVRDPRRWSIDTPTLYSCRVVVRDGAGVEIDRDETTFGIRSLQLDAARGLQINGEVANLRGACIHHDNGVIGAATVERADERRIEILKASGFNAIRSAHHPASKALLDACDRVGMLVMDEAFDMWHHPKMRNDYSRVFSEWWESDIDAMVHKDRNHPSVVLYSIGNEIPDTGDPMGADLGRRLADRVRELDDTRYVTNGVNPLIAVGIQTIIEMATPSPDADSGSDAEASEENTGVNTLMQRLREALPGLLQSEEVAQKLDEPYSYLDVAGYNYADSRYVLDAARMPNRVMVGTETHNTNIAQNWPKVLALPHVIGDFTWTGWDYLGEVGLGRVEYGEDSGLLMGDYPWLAAWCADIDITGGRRTLSHLREIVFGLRTEPHISVRDPARHGSTPTHEGLAGETVARGPGLVVVARFGRLPHHGRRPERRRRGGAHRQRQFRRAATDRRGAPLPHRVRDRLRTRRDRRRRLPRRGRGRPHRAALGRGARRARRARRSHRDPRRRHRPRLRRDHPHRRRRATAPHRRSRRHRRGRRTRRAPGTRQRQPPDGRAVRRVNPPHVPREGARRRATDRTGHDQRHGHLRRPS